MRDIRRKKFNNSVWIPLRASSQNERQGRFGYEGYKEEFFGAGSIAFPIEFEKAVKSLSWTDIGIGHQHNGYVEDGHYTPSDVYRDYQGKFSGIHLVLDQLLINEPSIWHLHQDLIVTLGLKREGDSWVCPQDGYVEVARLKRGDGDKPVLMEMKSQYLKDYLCARGMGLYLTSFFSRDAIIANGKDVPWDGNSEERTESGLWQGSVFPIHEGGQPFGEKVAVFHIKRTDVDESDDVPDISSVPTDENTEYETHERTFEGKNLYRVLGELWRNEWIHPGKQSPKVRGDEVDVKVFFTIDEEGGKCSGEELVHSGKWLWFRPDVIMALCNRRGGSLSFYTRDTGAVSPSSENAVDFGVNELGFVNVFAKDIGLLPEWQQQIWAGQNITPEGGVSRELLASQVRAEPVNTQAPEEFLLDGIALVNRTAQDEVGIKLFRNHDIIPELAARVHRFRAVDEASLYALAKDLARLTADSLDTEAMQSIVSPPKKEKWGSLKSLENLLAQKHDRELVRKITAPLVGVYELRHADAHLPSSKIEDAFQLIDIDRSQPLVRQGYHMLYKCVTSIFGIAEALKRWS